jgi:hypothetical protein
VEIAWTVVSVVVAILVGVAFTVVGYIPPEFRAARWCFGCSALILGGMSIVWQVQTDKSLFVRLLVGILLWGLIGAGLPEAFRWIKRRQVASSDAPLPKPAAIADDESKPPTLSDLFKSGFPNTMKIDGNGWTLLDKNRVQVLSGPTKVYLDFEARTKFIAFYITHSDQSYAAAVNLWAQVPVTFSSVEKSIEIQGGYQPNLTDLRDLRFSGRVFMYHEDMFNLRQLADLVDIYKSHGMALDFRGPSFLSDQVMAWHRTHDARADKK